MLTARTLVCRGGLEIADVSCRHGRGRGQASESSARHAVVFVRRGCFVHRADGRASVLDATQAYCISPGVELRYDHPHEGGDDCTAVHLDAELLASLWGGEPALPSGPLPVGPALDLEHRALLAAARHADEHELLERGLELVARALAQADKRRARAGRPATERARRELCDAARERLAADPGWGQVELARALAVSPHHLSRIFRAQTGTALARHRLRLRVRTALERLAGGERDLARLAADAGFADHSHLCRAIRSETGSTPGRLRELLGG